MIEKYLASSCSVAVLRSIFTFPGILSVFILLAHTIAARLHSLFCRTTRFNSAVLYLHDVVLFFVPCRCFLVSWHPCRCRGPRAPHQSCISRSGRSCAPAKALPRSVTNAFLIAASLVQTQPLPALCLNHRLKPKV